MTISRQRLGALGERLAARHLANNDYSILQTNYRSKSGEIDIVAEKDGMLVFVEVRTRTGTGAGSPEESITESKRDHLIDAAQEYLQAHNAENRDWRIDLVAVQFDSSRKLQRIHIVENAIEV